MALIGSNPDFFTLKTDAASFLNNVIVGILVDIGTGTWDVKAIADRCRDIELIRRVLVLG